MTNLGQSALAALLAAAIAAGFFLPWLSIPLLAPVTPLRVLSETGLDGLADAPVVVLLFFASFPLAALAALAALFGRCPRLLALAVAALPIGLALYLASNITVELRRSGLPLRASDLTGFLDFGGYVYISAAAALALQALLDPGARAVSRRP
jgi:hypothetical protein